MSSTRRTAEWATSSASKFSSAASSVNSRTGTWGTGSRPAARIATQVDSVSRHLWPGMWLTYISVPGGSKSRHASRCTLSCHVISTDAACASAAISCCSPLAPLFRLRGKTVAGDDIGLVLEPQPAMPLQYIARRVEIARVPHDRLKPLVLDLCDVDRSVPRREQR